ncbi:hypothetical protein O9G_006363 [Rozella allomycis CSF55]|uniref:HCP-like protein n=1 Tax=Rozella allomycis (strain CSF55) TaxID=988480 RepID=A0A075B4H5_ROZAC|nr:hypothetical protein O9G_006363 [Rozella allomycis CSF55]|eukprot:EPZ36362.1 hypothetical protein O9G_006363 [Rozella allomycis CSF55]
MYELGLGVKTNLKEAIKCFINEGNPVAAYNLGMICMEGRGLEEANPKKALVYFKEALRNGHPEAKQRLNEVYQDFDLGIDQDENEDHELSFSTINV